MTLSRIRTFGSHAILMAGAFVMIYPFFWMWRASVRDTGAIFGAMENAPSLWDSAADNYGRALLETPVLRFMLNGALMTGGILAAQLLTTIACAFALAKYEFRGRRLLFALVLLSLAVPAQATALPIFMALAKFGLLDSYFAVVAPYLTSGFAIFLFSQFIRGFPDEIILAARLDGMSEVEILVRVVVPAMVPAIAAFSSNHLYNVKNGYTLIYPTLAIWQNMMAML